MKKKPALNTLTQEEYEKRLKKIIIAGLGKAWMFWPPRLEAKKHAKHPTKSGWYICEKCKAEREKIEIDHIVPCIKPAEGFRSWDEYITRRFVFNSMDLQALCHECHREKSKEENKRRREMKKEAE